MRDAGVQSFAIAGASQYFESLRIVDIFVQAERDWYVEGCCFAVASTYIAHFFFVSVTYSAGQWGGTRAGVALRTTLGELGCLPVSAMIHIPMAQNLFDRDGNIDTSKDNNDPERWQKYCERCFSQLEWWADATRRHREVADPFNESPAFGRSPEQRNAP